MVSFTPILYRLELILPMLYKIHKDHRSAWWDPRPIGIVLFLGIIPGGITLLLSVFTGLMVPAMLMFYDLTSLTKLHFGWETWSATPWSSRLVFWGFLYLFFKWDYRQMKKAKSSLKDLNKFLGSHKPLGTSISELSFLEKPKPQAFRVRLVRWFDEKVVKSGGRPLASLLIGDQPRTLEIWLTLWVSQFLPIIVLRLVSFFTIPFWYLHAALYICITAGTVLSIWAMAAKGGFLNPPSYGLFKQFFLDNVDLKGATSSMQSMAGDSIQEYSDKLKASIQEKTDKLKEDANKLKDKVTDESKL